MSGDSSQFDADPRHRLDSVIADYLTAVQSNGSSDRQLLLQQHPDLADSLRDFFTDQDHFEQVAGPLRKVLSDGQANGGSAWQFSTQVYPARTAVSVLPSGYRFGDYFSMKLIEGGDLTQHISRLVGRPRAAAQLMASVADAVHHAHQRGILHRDLKPRNILLDQQGAPQVTDFGLAKLVEASGEATQSGAIVGTVGYMAPEQARAEKSITTAADIYSLGAILYELLTGRPPFRGATPAETLLQVLQRSPESARETCAGALMETWRPSA